MWFSSSSWSSILSPSYLKDAFRVDFYSFLTTLSRVHLSLLLLFPLSYYAMIIMGRTSLLHKERPSYTTPLSPRIRLLLNWKSVSFLKQTNWTYWLQKERHIQNVKNTYKNLKIMFFGSKVVNSLVTRVCANLYDCITADFSPEVAHKVRTAVGYIQYTYHLTCNYKYQLGKVLQKVHFILTTNLN